MIEKTYEKIRLCCPMKDTFIKKGIKIDES
jgi:hypothetical protein